MNNHLYNKTLQPCAKDLRYSMTKAEALEKAGYRVIRFSDNEVLKDMSNVILRIESFIDDCE